MSHAIKVSITETSRENLQEKVENASLFFRLHEAAYSKDWRVEGKVGKAASMKASLSKAFRGNTPDHIAEEALLEEINDYLEELQNEKDQKNQAQTPGFDISKIQRGQGLATQTRSR